MKYVMKHVKGHVEVYLGGKFIFSADNIDEARSELREYIKRKEGRYE